MSDRLAELSDDAAHEIRTALTESREGLLIAQKRIDGLRKSPLLLNGTRASLETLRRKLGEAEELYITVFSQVNANYGDETARPAIFFNPAVLGATRYEPEPENDDAPLISAKRELPAADS